jgi:hypothetical protein
MKMEENVFFAAPRPVIYGLGSGKRRRASERARLRLYSLSGAGRRDRQKNRQGQKRLAVLFVTVLAAVNFLFFVGQIEDMGKLLLYGGDAPGIFTVDHIDKAVGKA